jgi:UDP-3-O-[3-hydroxymyristoyl] glucosamine N-acyltransferase
MISLHTLANELGINIDCDDISITAINTLTHAKEGELTFLDNSKYLSQLQTTQASAVLIKAEFVDQLPSNVIALTTDEPYLKLALATKLFAPKEFVEEGDDPIVGKKCHIADNVYISPGVVIGDRVTIMPGCYIGTNVVIGDDTLLHPNVVVYRDSQIGKRCIIHAGTAIGSDGFGFAHTKMGEHIKIYQNGHVIIEDDVELGSNCSVDRAVFGATVIKQGTKLDNLIQIAHNVEIGEHTLMAAQSAVSGSSKLGRNVVMGGQSATAGHLEVAPFTTIAARGGVSKNIKESGKTWGGFPLMEQRIWLRLQGKIAKLLKS